MSGRTEIKKAACHFCPSRCGILLHVADDKLIKVEGDPSDPVSMGWTCAQGRGEVKKQFRRRR